MFRVGPTFQGRGPTFQGRSFNVVYKIVGMRSSLLQKSNFGPNVVYKTFGMRSSSGEPSGQGAEG